jgi:hypothetical protein
MLGVVAGLVVFSFALAGCSSGNPASVAKTTTSTTPPSSTTSLPATGTKVALGTNNPAVGDCTTKTSEAATAVGYVVLNVTAQSFRADIHLQKGEPNTKYGVFMQQFPGSCPHNQFNGGMLTTSSTGSASFVATVPRVAGATTFFVQLVNGVINSEYTSDHVSGVS